MPKSTLEELNKIDRQVGEWWLPSHDTKYAGYLQKHGEKITLALSGICHGPSPFRGHDQEIPAVHGSVGGTTISLLKCYAQNCSESHNIRTGMTSWRCDFLLIWCLIGGGHFDLDSSFRAISFTTNELHKIFWKHPLIHIMPDYECTDIVLGSESRKAGINLKKSRHALFEDPNLNVLRARPDFS